MLNTWICSACETLCPQDEILYAYNPFNPHEDCSGCPHCYSINSFVEVCKFGDCKKIADCGTPTPDGYLCLCGEHYYSRLMEQMEQRDRDAVGSGELW